MLLTLPCPIFTSMLIHNLEIFPWETLTEEEQLPGKLKLLLPPAKESEKLQVLDFEMCVESIGISKKVRAITTPVTGTNFCIFLRYNATINPYLTINLP